MSTTSRELINGHYYQVTRDDQGVIVSQVGDDPPPVQSIVLSKLGYRNLMTLSERIAIDSYAANPALTDTQKATLNSLHYDFQLADNIDLSDPQLIAGTQLLEQYGLLGAGRAAQILANQPAPTA